MRHYEAGAQLVCIEGSRFAYGTTIDQCCTWAAFDRIGNAQSISRIGIAFAHGSDVALTEAKAKWLTEPALQGLRRLVEKLLIEGDYATELLAIDLCDRLLYSLMYVHLDEAALVGGAEAYSLLAQHFSTWFDDNRRWIRPARQDLAVRPRVRRLEPRGLRRRDRAAVGPGGRGRR